MCLVILIIRTYSNKCIYINCLQKHLASKTTLLSYERNIYQTLFYFPIIHDNMRQYSRRICLRFGCLLLSVVDHNRSWVVMSFSVALAFNEKCNYLKTKHNVPRHYIFVSIMLAPLSTFSSVVSRRYTGKLSVLLVCLI